MAYAPHGGVFSVIVDRLDVSFTAKHGVLAGAARVFPMARGPGLSSGGGLEGLGRGRLGW